MSRSNRKRFVEIPADRLIAELEEIGGGVAAVGGSYAWRVQGRERVFDLSPVTPAGNRALPAQIRIYTSLAVGSTVARDCGKDAIRIVVGALEDDADDFGPRGVYKFRPVEKATKILRTAPRGVEDRVGVFLARLRDALRDAYRRARNVQSCPDCSGLMATRKGSNGPFLGCLNYPRCRHTERVS